MALIASNSTVMYVALIASNSTVKYVALIASNSTVKYVALIASKLTHEAFHLYVSYFSSIARCEQNKSKHMCVASVNVNKDVFTNKVCVCLCTCTSTISIQFLYHVYCKNTIS